MRMWSERVVIALLIAHVVLLCCGRRDSAKMHVVEPSARSEVTTTGSPRSSSGEGAASVDTTRMPVPPQSSTVINLTSPIKIAGTVTDVTYNVTGSMPSSTAISLGTTGRLERVRVNVN